jgi:cytochrome b561
MATSLPKETTPPLRYTRTARILHWVMAALIVAMLLSGERTMGSHDARILPTIHASAGFIVILLFAIRVYWRWKYPPPLAANRPLLEALAAKAVHGSLYVAMLLIPLTGWLAYTEHVRRSFGTRPASLFGLKIPLLPDFGINWHLIHNWGGKLVLVLIAVHAAAALKHHVFDRDETLKRMLP